MSNARVLIPLLLALASQPLHAQTVRGVVREAGTDRPIGGARLYLLDAAGAAVDSIRTDGSGRFRLGGPAAGDYAIHFQMDGWATYTSAMIRLEAGRTREHVFEVPLVSNEAIRQMADVIASDPRLQEALPELCGEELRPWEAGLLIGVVRERSSRAPIAGASVAVAGRSTLSNDRGVYILCNVPLGSAIDVRVELPDGATEVTPVEIRAGTISWYDLFVRRRSPAATAGAARGRGTPAESDGVAGVRCCE